MENFASGLQFMALHAQDANVDGMEVIDVKSNKSPGSDRGRERTIDMFKLLSKRQLQGLYEYYRLDFEVFGYSVDEFLKFT